MGLIMGMAFSLFLCRISSRHVLLAYESGRNAIQFTVDKTKLKFKPKTVDEQKEADIAAMVCSLANREACVMCSS